MQRFAQLYAELDASTATEAKLAALQRYLADAPTAALATPASSAAPASPASPASGAP